MRIFKQNFFHTFFFTLIIAVSLFAFNAQASTGTIDDINHTSYLCADQHCTTGSLINWKTSHGNSVQVTNDLITGDIFGTVISWIKLNPTSPAPSVPGCAYSHLVMEPSGSGIIKGCAWGENVGWVNFSPTYGGVTIDSSDYFIGKSIEIRVGSTAFYLKVYDIKKKG